MLQVDRPFKSARPLLAPQSYGTKHKQTSPPAQWHWQGRFSDWLSASDCRLARAPGFIKSLNFSLPWGVRQRQNKSKQKSIKAPWGVRQRQNKSKQKYFKAHNAACRCISLVSYHSVFFLFFFFWGGVVLFFTEYIQTLAKLSFCKIKKKTLYITITYRKYAYFLGM